MLREKVRNIVFDVLRKRLSLNEISVDDEVNLFEERLLDSMGAIVIVARVQAEFQCSISSERLTAEEIGSVGSLCRLIESLTAAAGESASPFNVPE